MGGVMKPSIRIGGTTYDAAQQTIGTSYAYYYADWTTNPNSTVAWTWADVNNLQAGMNSYSDNFPAPYVEVSQVYVQVYYSSGSGSDGIYGPNVASGNLQLSSTTNGTKGYVIIANDASKVAIGKGDASEKLDVAGNVSISDNLKVDTKTLIVDSVNNRVGINYAYALSSEFEVHPSVAEGSATIRIAPQTSAAPVNAQIYFYNPWQGSWMAGSYVDATPDTFFNIVPGTSLNSATGFHMNETGSVGIGTQYPTHTLNVVGSMNITGIGLITNLSVSNSVKYKNSTGTEVWRTYTNSSGALITEYIG
jgi:hypothetical protein